MQAVPCRHTKGELFHNVYVVHAFHSRRVRLSKTVLIIEVLAFYRVPILLEDILIHVNH